MIEVVLINGVRIWLNALKIVHVLQGAGEGVTDIQMEDGTIYNAKADPSKAAGSITMTLKQIHRRVVS